jgi:hypothetical protein
MSSDRTSKEVLKGSRAISKMYTGKKLFFLKKQSSILFFCILIKRLLVFTLDIAELSNSQILSEPSVIITNQQEKS